MFGPEEIPKAVPSEEESTEEADLARESANDAHAEEAMNKAVFAIDETTDDDRVQNELQAEGIPYERDARFSNADIINRGGSSVPKKRVEELDENASFALGHIPEPSREEREKKAQNL